MESSLIVSSSISVDKGKGKAPQRKPKRFVQQQRDSLTRRMSTGQPGSKRHQRFMNQVFLFGGIELNPNEIELEWNICTDWKSSFRLLFEDESAYKEWEPFIDITEETEVELLKTYSKRKPLKNNSPKARFAALPSLHKNVLKSSRITAIVSIESEIVDFVLGSTPSIKFFFDTDYHKLLCFSICKYYKLKVEFLEGESEREKVMLLRKPDGLEMPETPIAEYINLLK